MMTSGKVILGALAGIAIGTSLGILFAPDKGSDTRKKISRKGSGYVEDLENKFDEFMDSITTKFETMMDEATKVTENGKEKVEKVNGELTSFVKSKV